MSFRLDALLSKELYKNVIIRLIGGDELMLNYFELEKESVEIPLHDHPVEHLVIMLEGEVEFIFKDQKLSLTEGRGLFLPAKMPHTARVISAPVKALEIWTCIEDEYYSVEEVSKVDSSKLWTSSRQRAPIKTNVARHPIITPKDVKCSWP